MPSPDATGPDDLQRAVSGVARAIADSLELREVWGRVAEACRTVVPFDGMGIARFEAGGRIRVYVTAGDPAAAGLEERVFGPGDSSPRIRPANLESLVLVNDLPSEADPSFPLDRRLIERGYRSLLRLPLGRRPDVLGSLVLIARAASRFTADHARRLALVAELIALALAHESLADAWRERRKRLDALERLVSALSGTLDVRTVFERIAEITKDMIPHDYVSLGLLSEDRRRARILANIGADGTTVELPDYAIPEEILHTVDWDYFLAREITVAGPNLARVHLVNRPPLPASVLDLRVDDQWMRFYTEMGVRSTLRATIRLNGMAVGGIEFSSRETDHFDDDQGEFAMRVAEHVALALAHQRLAEEARRTVAAQDRAARLEERVQVLVEELSHLSPHRALGQSKKWKDVLAQATKVAPTDTTVLLTGESGTGKEVVARFLHRGSARKDGPFVALNCAALPEQLLESELFGHEKGAFTGALQARPGKIEQAGGGVLFLDEVGEMSLAVQAKFLRVLQEREYQRLGGVRTLRADMRVLAATNRNLKAAISQGTFREDLYYRLAVFDIALPALRERPEDVAVLVEAFLEEIGRTVGRPAGGVSEEAREKLVAYAWPGNVRELRNAIERAVILCEGGLITSEHLPLGIASVGIAAGGAAAAASPGAGPPAAVTLDAAEREMIVQALAKAGQNKSKAARLLGLTRAQLRSRIEKHGLEDAAAHGNS
jgi:transcriptional regulator with GAF, ATPase, and Fis domain